MAELDNGNSNRGLGCSWEALLIGVALLTIVALVLFLWLQEPSTVETAKAQRRIERAEAWQPWNVALGIVWRVVAIGVGLTLLAGLVAAVRAGVRKLDLNARLIRPDRETGQLPAYRARRGETIIDLNRVVDGKAQTAILGGKTLLLTALLFRYVLRREPPPELRQPAISVLPPDVSPAQVQVTTQAQAVQALAAASRGGSPQQTAQAVQMLTAPPAALPHGLPPLLAEGTQPREVQLLLEAGRRQWQSQSDEVVDVAL